MTLRTTGDRRDRLTISRLLVLTAGVAIGLRLLAPPPADIDVRSVDAWRRLASCVLIGLSLPGPIYTIRRPRGDRLGIGGLLWLALGLGALLLLPAAVHKGRTAEACLYYTLPLMSLWTVLAAALGGLLRRRRLRAAAWRDRFGLYLGLAWSPLAIWHLVDFYREAFQ